MTEGTVVEALIIQEGPTLYDQFFGDLLLSSRGGLGPIGIGLRGRLDVFLSQGLGLIVG